MKQVKNKKTGVVKVLTSEAEISMYLSTGEWEIFKKEKEQKKITNSFKKNDN